MKFFSTTAGCLLSLPLFALAQNGSLPIVNLGYERHQAINFNQSAGTYNFSNIRFAQPPVGDLRFRAPVPAWTAPNSSTVNNGSVGAICPQANPAWELIAEEFIPDYLVNKTFNETAAIQQLQSNSSSLAAAARPDPRTNEDCLFLDVIVPQSIFNKAENAYGAPVLVWIYGGGYTGGEKTGGGTYNPYGLLTQAQNATGQQFIFVTLNYRLGAFGWLSGPTVQSDGTANAGLYDQRTALLWVQKYISQFGGDPDRVTVIGESAGGGSIMHQITAFNGMQGTPFAQAIPQSPGFVPITSSLEQETTFNTFLKYANVTSLAALRNLSTSALQLANTLQVAYSPYGTFSYGPVRDGIFAPQLPSRALATGSFDPNLRLLIGHNSDEGLLFTQPNETTNAAFAAELAMTYPDINPSILNYITNTLYPPVFDGSYGYTTQLQRSILATSESIFTCNTFYLDRAFKNNTHSYQFSAFPGIHGQDITYTFADGDATQQVPLVALALQTYITTFVINGMPTNTNAAGVPMFPTYGTNDTVVNLNTNISQIMDANASPRCQFWQQALFD